MTDKPLTPDQDHVLTLILRAFATLKPKWERMYRMPDKSYILRDG